MKNNTYIVYKHTNPYNNKVYIGITIHGNNPNARWIGGSGYQFNTEFYNDILYYGWGNIKHEILENNLDRIQAEKREKYYIALFDSTNPEKGYNKSAGGNIPSEEGRKRISEALMGIKRSEDSIQKQINTKYERYGNQKSINYPGYTRKVECIETNDIFYSISDAMRWAGSSKIQACCDGEREHAGRHPETGAQLSWEYADSNSEITIICDTEIQKRNKIQKIQCIETGEIYANASDASRNTGIATCNILRVCKGQRKSAGGKHWIFVKE